MTTCEAAVLAFLAPLLAAHAAQSSPARAFVLGITGPQGSGKTTLAAAVASGCGGGVSASLDDFYLTAAQQAAVAAGGNALLQRRGMPGTHDMALLGGTVDAVCAGRAVQLPAYDKGARGGGGDRAPAVAWRQVDGPVRLLVLEGWCVGFAALGGGAVRARHAAAPAGSALAQHTVGALDELDGAVAAYEAAVGARLDALVQLDAPDVRWVYGWRREQEARLRESRGEGMTDAQVDAFVDGYMTAYQLYLDGLRHGGVVPAGRHLRLVVDQMRQVVHTEVM